MDWLQVLVRGDNDETPVLADSGVGKVRPCRNGGVAVLASSRFAGVAADCRVDVVERDREQPAPGAGHEDESVAVLGVVATP